MLYCKRKLYKTLIAYPVERPVSLFTNNIVALCTFHRNFLHMVDEVEPLIILIKTTEAEIFGAFCSSAWGERKHERKFFGTGETFVFTFEKGDTIKVFKWIGYGASCNVRETCYVKSDII